MARRPAGGLKAVYVYTAVTVGLLFLLAPGPSIRAAGPAADALAAYLRVFPDTRRIGVIYTDKRQEASLKELEAVADREKILVIRFYAPTIKSFPPALLESKGKVDTIWFLEYPLYSTQEAWSYFILFSLKNRVRSVVPEYDAVKECGLFYYSPQGEIVINRKILKVLNYGISGEAGPITYYESET